MIHCFKNEDGDMWQSESNYYKDAEFIMGGVMTVMPCNTIVGLDNAVMCVREFWNGLERPDCISWRRL